MTTPTRASYSTIVMFRVYLSSIVSMLLLGKVIVSEWTLVVISNMVPFTVQILESVRTRYTSCSSLSRRVRLRVGLAISS